MNCNQAGWFAFSAIIIVVVFSACVYRSDINSDSTANSHAHPAKTAETLIKGGEKSGANQKEDRGDFIVEHSAIKNASYEAIERRLKDEKLLEKAADKLNRNLILPHDIFLRTKYCGEVNAFYSADERAVTVCYELMEHFYEVFRRDALNDEKAYGKMFDAVRFAFLHEIGHALIDVYNLPISGSEEDAADRCSAFINLTEFGADGAGAVIAAAEAFSIESKNDSPDKRYLAGEHLLHEQRFYNSICLLYGSDAEKYGYLLEENYLPRERAEHCAQEYERTVDSWSSLLAPWRRS